MSEKNPIIRTIYLYLFALIGLGLLAIGVGRFVDLGLKTFVFTKADDNYYSEVRKPSEMTVRGDMSVLANELADCSDKCDISDEDQVLIDEWLAEYKDYQENGEQRVADQKTARRQRDAAGALSQLLIGLPLWLYHWRTIKRDRKEV